MAYDLSKLRLQNLASGYDQLTPGMGGGANYSDDYSLGSEPESQPSPGLAAVGDQGWSSQNEDQPDPNSPIQTPTIEAPRVNPNARTFKQTLDEMNAGYTPDYTSRDRNNRLLDAPPERQSPGWGRTLVAAGMSVKAADPIGTAEKIQYAPYYRDVEDWKTKADPYYKAAELENRQNINERTIVSNAATSYAAAERNRIAEENNAEKNRINEVRTKAYAWKQMHPDWDWDTTGPTYVLKGPNGEIQNTGIKTGQMSEEDLQLLKNKGSIAAAQARGAAAVDVARAGAVAGNRDTVVIDGQLYQRNPDRTLSPVEGAPEGQVYRPGSGPPRASTTGAGGTATNRLEARRQINDRLAETYQTDPTNREYVKKTGDGKFDFTDRPKVGTTVGSTFGFGGKKVTEEDVAHYDEFRSAVDPSYKAPTKGLGPTSVPATSTVPNTNSGTRTSDPGTIMATGPNGNQHKITNDPEVIAHWKSKGYTVGSSGPGIGPTTTPEPWQPRGDYTVKPKGTEKPATTEENTPWFVKGIKEANKAPKEGDLGVYGEQTNTPTGPKRVADQVSTGMVAIRDKQTGEIKEIPEANLARAIATKRYEKVQ